MKECRVLTKRLCILPQSMEQIAALRDAEPDEEMRQAYGEMMETIRLLPGQEEWGTQWEIQLRGGSAIGGLCFKGAPDQDGAVEVGYGIDETYRNQGYAAEAVSGIVKWALAQKEVTCVTAQTEADNVISQRVLTKCGFVRDGLGPEGPLYRSRLEENSSGRTMDTDS